VLRGDDATQEQRDPRAMLTKEEAHAAVLAEWTTWSKENLSHLRVSQLAKSSDALLFFAHVQKNKAWMLDFKAGTHKWLVVKGWLLHKGVVTD
jgi:hypothetical protein